MKSYKLVLVAVIVLALSGLRLTEVDTRIAPAYAAYNCQHFLYTGWVYKPDSHYQGGAFFDVKKRAAVWYRFGRITAGANSVIGSCLIT